MFIDMWSFGFRTPAACYVVAGSSSWGGAHSTPLACGYHVDHGSINIAPPPGCGYRRTVLSARMLESL